MGSDVAVVIAGIYDSILACRIASDLKNAGSCVIAARSISLISPYLGETPILDTWSLLDSRADKNLQIIVDAVFNVPTGGSPAGTVLAAQSSFDPSIVTLIDCIRRCTGETALVRLDISEIRAGLEGRRIMFVAYSADEKSEAMCKVLLNVFCSLSHEAVGSIDQLLISVEGGYDIGVSDAKEVAEKLCEITGASNCMWSFSIDPDMNGEIKVLAVFLSEKRAKDEEY